MTYRGEVCEECGFPVAHFVGSFWNAEDGLWNDVTGTLDNPRGEGVILCPRCFTAIAARRGIFVSWVACEYGRQAHAISSSTGVRFGSECGAADALNAQDRESGIPPATGFPAGDGQAAPVDHDALASPAPDREAE